MSDTSGQARLLPAGRLANFEDGDDAPDLATLLPRRAAPKKPAAEPAAAAPATPTDGDDTTRPAPPTRTPGRRRTRDAAGSATPVPAAPEQPESPASARDAALAGTAASPPQRRPGRPRKGAASVAAGRRRNEIRPTNVQVPVALLDQIVELRHRTGRSNGDIVRDALEATHERLGQLVPQHDGGSGGLFAARASRSVRVVDGPLTPLNLRLMEDDFRVIDKLVDRFGAFSRGHLISVALTDYLRSQQDPGSRP